MARDWNVTFNYWASPPSDTELEKCGNAERAIRKAIVASQALVLRDIRVFVQGSYANGTNVRQDSDVDVCVLYNDAFFSDYSLAEAGMSDSRLGFTDGHYASPSTPS
jgi:tRNA nucleotidyltransferase (CCA-adding enzyme)